MDATVTATVERTDPRNDRNARAPRSSPVPIGNAGPDVPPVMLTVEQVARMLNCSTRTVYRLNSAGRMPRPVRLGALVRWRRAAIEQWIAEGCLRCSQEI